MEKRVAIRLVCGADMRSLENIIRKTWQYDRFCTPKTAERMARLYLASCLSRQTFARVAVSDGKTVGVIMGKDYRKHSLNLRYRLRQWAATLALYAGREGRRTTRAFSCVDELDRQMLQATGKEYQGEVAFFAVDETCRGLGIGKRLFDELQSYMQGQGIECFFLFTDSSCNFGFYEHQGLKRRQTRKYEVPLGIRNKMEFYLYEYA